MDLVRNKPLDQIYITAFFRSTGRSLVRLFVPVYLMGQGFSLPEVAVNYFVLNYFFWIVWATVVSTFIKQLGLRLCFILGVIFSALDVVILFNIKDYGIPLGVAACLHGASEALFWTAYHVHFLRASNNKARGRIISIIRILAKVGKAIGPAVGGWFLQESHTTSLVVVSAVLLGISVLPLVWIETREDEVHLEVHEPLNSESLPSSIIQEKPLAEHNFATIVCFVTNGIEKGYGNTLWPLYTALVFFNQKAKLFGAFSSLVLFASLILTFAIGKFVDTERYKSLYFGMGTSVLLWIFRFFSTNPVHVAIGDILYGIANAVLTISFFATLYSRATSQSLIQFVLQQEVCIALGEIIAWAVIVVVSTDTSFPAVVFFVPTISVFIQAAAIRISST